MTLPLISIITPSFNQAEFLEHTLFSVFEQNYPNLEYLVYDGGSSDGSPDILRKYARHLTYWQSQPDGGQVRAINAGFQRATGQIFTFLNSDDLLLPGALHHMAELYARHPRAAGWVGGGISITSDGFILQTRLPQETRRELLADWCENWVFQPACFFSARIARQVGFFDPAYELAFDFDFWLKIASQGKLIATTRLIAGNTIHLGAKTQRNRLQMFEETQAIQIANGFTEFATRTQVWIDRALKEPSIAQAARLLFDTHRLKREFPDRYIQFPRKPADD